MTIPEAVSAIAADEHSRMFVMDDWVSKQNFWKQFLSGVFIVIVMTGLDQDMILVVGCSAGDAGRNGRIRYFAVWICSA